MNILSENKNTKTVPSVMANVVTGNASIRAKTKLCQFADTALMSEKMIDEISTNPDVQKSEITIWNEGIKAPIEADKTITVKASLRFEELRTSLSTLVIILPKSSFGS